MGILIIVINNVIKINDIFEILKWNIKIIKKIKLKILQKVQGQKGAFQE